MARNGLASELWAFMRERKKWWLLPVVVVMVLVGGLVIFARPNGNANATPASGPASARTVRSCAGHPR